MYEYLYIYSICVYIYMYILHTVVYIVVSNLLDHKLCMFVPAALSFQVILPRPNVLQVFPGDSQVEALQPWTLLLRVSFLR